MPAARRPVGGLWMDPGQWAGATVPEKTKFGADLPPPSLLEAKIFSQNLTKLRRLVQRAPPQERRVWPHVKNVKDDV